MPGNKQAKIFPFIRKVDTNSSNSYIISTPAHVIVIDPGGLPDQMDLLAAEVELLREKNPVPVIVILTHAHIDHFLVVQDHPFFNSHGSVVLAAHTRAAVSLGAADRESTQAALFGQFVQPVHVPMVFFSKTTPTGNESATIRPDVISGMDIQDSDIGVDENLTIRRQVIRSRAGEKIEIYELPGHSPDSICIRIGELLFIGDLLFAANPVIAGIRGWDQKDLILTLEKVLWLLDNEDIRMCCPGHGRVISADSARTIFLAMRNDVPRLNEIAQVTPDWAKETARYAETLMDRVSGCFTIMAGRCYRAAHILEELEESGEAEKITDILNIRIIDEILADFHRFNEDYRKGNQRDVHLALKAGQIASKLENVYKSEGLDLVIDPSLVRRAARLLSDYMTTFRGFHQISVKEIFELDETLGSFIKRFTGTPCSDEELMSLADNEEEYTRAFVRRLVHVPLFPEDPVTFECSERPCMACADIERLTDLIASILEDLAGADYRGIIVGVDSDENKAVISIRARRSGIEMNISGKDLGFMKKECETAGGSLSVGTESPDFSVCITLPRADQH